MPIVHIPPPYRGPTQGRAEIQVEGATVLECLEAVEARHPGFRELVIDPKGELHRFVRLFVNGEQLDRDALGAAVKESDQLEVLAAIGGGV
jgi:molybdopterin synthase sulfur carrier subunit